MRLAIVPLLSVLATTPLFAWTPATYERIASKSSDLAPPDMRLLIDRYRGEFRRGLETDTSSELRHTFLVDARRGALRNEIHSEVRSAIKKIRDRQSLASFVETLGRVAHLVADANNPFAVANTPPRLVESRADFESYLERKLPKIPTVFYGLQSQFKLEPYVDTTLVRAANFYPLLDEEYFRGGGRRTSGEFDDRSTAFGIASVSYSRSVSDVVNIYYFIWKEAGGDVRAGESLRRGNLLLNE